MLPAFSRFAQDASYPYGAGGPNGSFALITDNYMREFGARREDFGAICVAQRANALANPHALMKKPLTLEQYMAGRPISDPVTLFDCVMPCAGAEAFLVMREEDARASGLPYARLLSTIERHNAYRRRHRAISRRLGARRRGDVGDGGPRSRRNRRRRDL